MTVSNRLYRVDSVKFIAAVLVVVIHTSWYMFVSEQRSFWTYDSYRGIADIAVPVFFVFSGYFLAREDVRGTLAYSAKLFVLYVASTLLFLIFDLARILADRVILDRGFYEALREEVGRWSMSAFIRGDLGEVHLWYLIASAIAGCLIAIMRARGASVTTMLVIAGATWGVSLSGLIDLKAVVAFGGFPKALAFLVVGIWLAERQVESVWWHPLLAAVALSGYTILRYFEAGNAREILLVVAAYGLAAFAIAPDARRTLVARLGKYSLTIYILHMMVYTMSTRVLKYMNIDYSAVSGEVWFTFGLAAVAVVVSIALHKPFEALVIRPCMQLAKRLVPHAARGEGVEVPPASGANQLGSLTL